MEKAIIAALVLTALCFGCIGSAGDGITREYNKSELAVFYDAVNRNDSEMCGKITDSEIRGWCLRDVGIATLNTTLCDQAGNVPDKYSCYIGISDKKASLQFCYNEVARAFPNYSDAVDGCIVRVGYAQGNESVCGLLSNKSRMGTCVGTARHYV